MNKHIVLLSLGFILIMSSLIPVYFIGGEFKTSIDVNKRYEVSLIRDIDYSKELQIDGQMITIKDDYLDSLKKDKPLDYEERRVSTTISTSINGRDYSMASKVIVRPFYSTTNRYWSWLSILKVTDLDTKIDQIAIIQRLTDSKENTESLSSLKWRILYVSSNGEVSEDNFKFSQRSLPPLRAKIVMEGFVSPEQISYKSQISTLIPSVLYPLLYPVFTFILGIFLFVKGNRIRKNRMLK